MKYYKKVINCFLIIFIFQILFSNVSYADYSNYIWNSKESLTSLVSNNITPSYTDDTSNPLKLDCESAILIEQSSSKILYSYNSHEKLRPASVTKIMSILLIMEALEQGKINYDTPISCSEKASSMGGSQIWLDSTETLTVSEMLKAICVVSANDCVVAMAEHLGGTEEGFVNMMNNKARELGMKDTTFKNCHGIDEDGHLTSSYDIALMSRELLNKYPEITKYTTIWTDSLRDGKSVLVNTNKLIRNYNGCTGLKTGSTSQALFNLSASATRDGLSLIAVIMKAPTSAIRFSNATNLLNYGFTNFEFISLAKKGDPVQTVNIDKGTESEVNAIFERDVGTLISKGNSINIDKKIDLPTTIQAPINQGDIIGKVTFSLNDNILETSNLISNNTIKKIDIFSMIGFMINKWFNLLR